MSISQTTEWPHVPLRECADILSGGTPSKSEPTYWGGELPWVSAKDMKIFRLHDAEDYVTPDGAANGTRVVPAGSTLVLVRGMTLHDHVPICWLLQDCAFNQDVKAVVPKAGVDAEYLAYWLAASERRLHALVDAAGHGTGRIGGPALASLPVRLPPLAEQRRIAAHLGCIDRKIELNRRMNGTLESIACAIFKSWFVDFDPARRRAEGGDASLPHDLAVLFPRELVDSELGQTPVGWPLRQLSEVLTAVNERAGDANTPEYSSTNEGLQPRAERFKKALSASTANNKLVRRGDFVFGLSRRVLNFGLMRDPVGSVSAAYKVFRVRPGSIEPDLLERMMRASSAYYYGAVSSSSREGQSVSSQSLGHLCFVQPPVPLQNAFLELTSPIDSLSAGLSLENLALEALRGTLLPRLLSGELTANAVAPKVEAGS